MNTALWKPARRRGTLFADLSPFAMTVSNPATQTESRTLTDRMDDFLS